MGPMIEPRYFAKMQRRRLTMDVGPRYVHSRLPRRRRVRAWLRPCNWCGGRFFHGSFHADD